VIECQIDSICPSNYFSCVYDFFPPLYLLNNLPDISVQQVNKITKMMPDLSYQEGQHRPLPQVPQGAPIKVTHGISCDIEALSLMDATFTNGEIRRTIIERFGVTFGESTVCIERRNLRFHFRPPMVEQSLTWQQWHVRFQFALDLLRTGIDLKTTVFSDEVRFAIVSDKQLRYVRQGCWNSACFAKHEKFPKLLLIWGAIGRGVQ
jgi:hypothetical protein